MFSPDFKKILFNLLPHFLRETKNLDWLNSLINPVETINGLFNSARNLILYRLQFTGQVNYLERVLNERFDPLFGILISDSIQPDRHYIFNTAELREDTFLFNTSTVPPASQATDVYIRSQTEHDNAIDFTVNVPLTVIFTYPEINGIINRYRQAGSQYNIVTF